MINLENLQAEEAERLADNHYVSTPFFYFN
jgi:hypothetical protein